MTAKRRTTLILAGMTFLISQLTLSVSMGVYFSHKLAESQHVLCGVAAVSLRPRPTPPADPDRPPTTKFGHDQQEYNDANAKITRDGQAQMRKVVRQYHCPNQQEEP